MQNNVIIKDYHELVNFSEKIRSAKKSRMFSLLFNNTTMQIVSLNETLTSDGNVYTYTFEYPQIAEFFKKLFMISEKDPLTTPYEVNVYCNKDNHYQFLMNVNMLDLLLTSVVLEATNVPLIRLAQIPKKNGKMRQLVIPDIQLRVILKKINKILQAAYDGRNADFQVAYKCGKNITDAARPHKNKKYMFKMDISTFFPSCKREFVKKYIRFLFKNSVNPEFLIEKFLDINLYEDALYIGNPISGTLANAIISRPVAYVKNMCNQFGISYTVYADDMMFGSDKYISKDFIVSLYDRAFMKYDMENFFILNEDKLYGLSGTNRNAVGVSFNQNNDMVCHRYLYNNIRMTLHQLSYGDESHYSFNELSGQIAFATMVDESGKIQRLLTRYKDICLSYGLWSQEKFDALEA